MSGFNHPTKCATCKAPVKWVRMSPSMKLMPLEAKPEKRIILNADGSRAKVVDTYASHFATCPNADAWRKQKAGKS